MVKSCDQKNVNVVFAYKSPQGEKSHNLSFVIIISKFVETNNSMKSFDMFGFKDSQKQWEFLCF